MVHGDICSLTMFLLHIVFPCCVSMYQVQPPTYPTCNEHNIKGDDTFALSDLWNQTWYVASVLYMLVVLVVELGILIKVYKYILVQHGAGVLN